MEDKLSSKGWEHLILFIFPYFFIVGLFQYIASFFLGIEKSLTTSLSLSQSTVFAFFGAIASFSVIYIFIRFVDRRPLTDLGFRNQKIYCSVLIGLFTGFFALAFGFLITLGLGQVKINTVNFSSSKILLSIILFAIIAFTEETLFRGYVLRNLMLSFRPYIGLLISALFFAIMHGFNPNINLIGLVNLFLAGILLGIPYIFNKNLWFPISLHFSWNFFQSLFGYNVSGQDSYSMIEFQKIEKNFINGGDFGFEGSIFSIIIQMVLIVCLFKYFQRQGKTSQI
ncbi:MAG: type II CAAX endopeptidase family protein [Bacteroidota bacterium]